VPIALSTLRGQHTIEQTVITAGSFLSLIPTVLFFLIVLTITLIQRRVLREEREIA